MKPHVPLAIAALVVAAGAGAAAAATLSGASAATGGVEASQSERDFYRHAEWDDDDDDRRRYGRLPQPDMGALRDAGFVQVTEVERDDGRIEIDGYDAQGRALDAIMDARGERVLRVRYDRDDHWDDDDRWDD